MKFSAALVVSLVMGYAGAWTPAVAQDRTVQPARTEPDNTRINKADRKPEDRDVRPTAQNQPQNKADRELAAAVRRAIVGDKSLSTYAHNIKVIAREGSVVLRGPVRSTEERNRLGEITQQVPDVKSVNNNVTVKIPAGK